jgi:hypothetical protein
MNMMKSANGKIHVALVKACNMNEPTSPIAIKIIFPFIFPHIMELSFHFLDWFFAGRCGFCPACFTPRSVWVRLGNTLSNRQYGSSLSFLHSEREYFYS